MIQSNGPIASTMICDQNYNLYYFLSHALIVLFIGIIACLIVNFTTKRHLFPVKERAPILALTQAIYFLLLLIVPYLVELFMGLGTKWDADKPKDIPFLRKFLKSLYISLRLTVYLIFLFR